MFPRNDRSIRTLASLLLMSAVAATALAEPPTGGMTPPSALAAALKIGSPAPDFSVVDLGGTTHTLRDLTRNGQIVVVEFFNPNCEHVATRYASGAMLDAQDMFAGRGVTWIVVATGKGMTPEIAADLRETADEWGILSPITIDAGGALAAQFGATMTPQAFVINRDGLLAYMGGVDNNPSGVTPAPEGTINYIVKALDEMLEGDTVTASQTAPHGCPITR